MALPLRDGKLFAYSTGSGNATIDVSEVPDGSWMLLVIVAGHSSASLAAPSGWTNLFSSFDMNTRAVAVMAKIKESGDGTVSISKSPASTSTSIGLVYGSGGDEPSEWQLGTGKFRNNPPSESVTTTALSITTTEADVLALSISAEATNAEDIGPGITPPATTGTGWENWLYVQDVESPNTTNIEQIRIGYKAMITPGATGNVTDTYPNSQTLNGWAVQIGITPSVIGGASPLPVVSTLPATDITPDSATGNGIVESDGGETITERGICWSTSPLPTTSDNKATAAGTTGSFDVEMTGLSNNTTYHMRAYAINSVGTAYGPNVTMISNGGPVVWIQQ